MLEISSRFGMDESMLICLTSTPTSPDQQAKALQYFEELKSSDVGWQMCVQAITSRAYTDDHIRFFCLQVIEHFAKCRYATSQPQHQQILRDFLCQWTRFEVDSNYHVPTGSDSSFIKNKIAQITALVFIQDYPVRWPNFFNEILFSCVQMGETAVDHYLRVLLAIDSEISDKDINRTNAELQRNGVIKQAMRENVVNNLVDSWFTILTNYEKTNPIIVCRCLHVIGAYIHWIDINLVANDRFVPLFVNELSVLTLREAAAECIYGIIMKGMDPLVKTKLVESFNTVLTNVGAWNAVRSSVEEDGDPEYIAKLGKILNGMGTSLIDAYHKILKSESKDSENCRAIIHAIESKIYLALDFLGYPYDEVSSAIFDFIRDYLHLIKSKTMMNEQEKQHLIKTLQTITKKMRCDDDYNFENEGEEEACFIEFRKQMKVLFDNIALIDKDLVLEQVQSMVTTSLQNWKKLPFEDVEVSLYLMYICGDATPSAGITNFTPDIENSSPIQLMMLVMINSEVHMHSNCGVVLQFFENAMKYDKFFLVHPENIVPILSAFLKNNGLFHRSRKVRSRCAYLFSKFIKTVKLSLVPNLTNNILHAIQPLLSLEAPFSHQESDRAIMEDDQMYLYEVVGLVIVGGESTSQKKAEYMRQIISPLLESVRMVTELLLNEKQPPKRHHFANILVQAISVTGRLSKAFSSQQNMKSCGCIPVFTDAMLMFISTLEKVPWQEQLIVLQGAVRQYLHRMVMCLEEELLPYIPVASQGLLKGGDPKSIQEYIPLINQVIHKYKVSWIFQKDVTPFLQQMFTPMVQTIFTALTAPIETNDQQAIREKQLMQRQYFHFIAAIVTNNLTEVLSSQEPVVLHEVMRTVMQGAVEFPDPVAQKACFSILKKLVELWGGQDGPEGFIDFMYNDIVPACFMAPMKPSFDITDAQTLIVLNETAMCLLAVLDKRKEEFIAYLQNRYLPTLKLPAITIQEYIQVLQSNPKSFKLYLKAFFTQAKS